MAGVGWRVWVVVVVCVGVGVGDGAGAVSAYMGRTVIPCFPSVTSQFNTASKITCAILCTIYRGTSYYFQGGVCTVGSPGQTVTSSSQSIFILTPMPPCSALREVAHGKATTASGSYSSYYASLYAVDTSMATWFASNPSDYKPWWTVDLGSVVCMYRIQLLPRGATDDSPYFRNVEVRIGLTDSTPGNYSSWALYATYPGPYPYGSGYIDLPNPAGVCGRYVNVQKVIDDRNCLKLFNVNIYIA